MIGVFAGFVFYQFVCAILAAIELWKVRFKDAKEEEEEDMERRRLRRRSYEDSEEKRFSEEM